MVHVHVRLIIEYEFCFNFLGLSWKLYLYNLTRKCKIWCLQFRSLIRYYSDELNKRWNKKWVCGKGGGEWRQREWVVESAHSCTIWEPVDRVIRKTSFKFRCLSCIQNQIEIVENDCHKIASRPEAELNSTNLLLKVFKTLVWAG